MPASAIQRAILHVDLDQFYAAVEVLDFPELKGQPVIVGGSPDSRGVVCTASYEARAFGVRSAMASATASRLCPQAIWRPPRMDRYAEKSREVRAVFDRYTDQIEPLSLDEAFLDLTGSIKLFGPADEIAQRIKREIRAETGLVASAGLAENKFLAKVASDLKKPDGFVVVPPGQENAERFLAPLPVNRLWGVGPKSAEVLQKLGFHTVGDIARADVVFLTARLGAIQAEHLYALAHGIDHRPVETGDRPKSIGKENSFARDLYDLDAMERELLACAEDIAQRLRSRALRCGGVTLKIRLSDLTRHTRAELLHEPTDVTEPIFQAAARMLRTRFDFKGQGARLLGIAATHLLSPDEITASLFPDESAERRRRVANAVDRLRDRFGEETITRGRLLEARERTTGTPSERPSDAKPKRTKGV
ncbi:MAG TPA: DNA polymerase IV [Planctomycetota bacterium]|nr:DNA polymerase IV [Planctomycetota bacterium]